ncbi:MAG: hypothetical protein LBN02_01155 [Oscillospiraceae bacterium]|jgi:hypothetical protein|nr:hypothetical protein [Oscillospiraceae bacterium]
MKKLTAAILIALALVTLTSCGNRKAFGAQQTFNRAIIELPNGEILEGDVKSWSRYSDSDLIQVEIDNVTYLVHSSKIILMYDKIAKTPTEDGN